MSTATAVLSSLLGSPVRQDPANGHIYRADKAVTLAAVRLLSNAEWCTSMYLNDGRDMSFTASCRISGCTVTVTGRVA